MTTDLPVEEMTRNPVDESYGYVCREHGLHRSGLTQLHATNLQAKHLREQHPADAEPVLNLSAMARTVLTLIEEADDGHTAGPAQQRAAGAFHVLRALFGAPSGITAISSDDLTAWAEAEADVTAAVVPF